MPLADFPDQSVYVRRTREHMAAHTRAPGDTVFNARVRPFKSVYQNIQATEMTNFDLPDNILANVFVAQRPGFTGNDRLDVRLTKSDLSSSLTFTADMPTEQTFPSFVAMVDVVVAAIITAMDAAGDAVFNSGNYTLSQPANPAVEPLGSFVMDSVGIDDIYIQFLFGSGNSTARNPAIALGFEPGFDTLIGAGTNVNEIQSLRVGYINLARYVDVKLLQNNNISTQNTILGRIFIPLPENYKQSRQVVSKARLFTDPVRRSELPRVLLLPGANRAPPPIASDGWNITTDMLAIAPEVVVPQWVNQWFVN